MNTDNPQRKRAAVAAAATVAVGAGAAPLLFPAGAAAYGKSDCQDNRLCLFSDGGFRNNLSQRQVAYDNSYVGDPFPGPDTAEHGLNDHVSAIWNHTNRWILLFENAGYSGHRICFPPQTAVRDLHQVEMKPGNLVTGGSKSWGNRISSHIMYFSRPSDCTAAGSTLVPEGQYGCSM